MKDFVTIDDAACVCGMAVGYKVAKATLETIAQNGGLITKAGCLLIQVYVGMEVGNLLRERTRKLRKAIKNTIKDLKEDQNG